MAAEKDKEFWEGKIPCWVIRKCEGKAGGAPDCVVYKNQKVPCWKLRGTICKGEKGDDISVCRICKVYKEYGKGEDIKLED
jgi:methyl-accepting chemotaxis protein